MTVMRPKPTLTYTSGDCRYAAVRYRGKQYILCYRDDPHALCEKTTPALTVITKAGKTEQKLFGHQALEEWAALMDKVRKTSVNFVREHYHLAAMDKNGCW